MQRSGHFTIRQLALVVVVCLACLAVLGKAMDYARDSQGQRLLAKASDTLMLSARACHSILKVARTIADLDHSDAVKTGHVAEAIQYRGIDRESGAMAAAATV